MSPETPDGPPKKLPNRRFSTFVQKATGSFGLRFAGLGLQFIGSILIARMLGVEGFGIYAYAMICITIAGTLLSLGMGQLAPRELPRFLVRNQPDLLRGFLTMLFSVPLGVGLVSIGVLIWLTYTDLVPLPVGWGLLGAGMITHALMLNMSAVLNGFQRILQSQFVETVLRQALFLAVLVILVFSGWTLGPQDIIVLSVLVALPILGLMVMLIRRAMANSDKPLKGQPNSRFEPKIWMISALPLLVMTFANQMQTNLDILILGVLADAADVGRYRAASRGADLMLIANGVALQVLGPMLSRALAGADQTVARQEAQRLITQSAKMSAILGAIIFIPLGLGASMYLGLFGPAFVEASPALRILLAAQMITLLFGPVGVIMITMGQERMVLWVSLGALVLNVALNFALIPIFGILGAAWATFVAVVLLKFVLLLLVVRRSGFEPTIRALRQID